MYQNHGRIARRISASFVQRGSLLSVTRFGLFEARIVGGLANPGPGRVAVVVRVHRIARRFPALCRRVLRADQFFGVSVSHLREERLKGSRFIDRIVLVIDRQSLLAKYPEN